MLRVYPLTLLAVVAISPVMLSCGGNDASDQSETSGTTVTKTAAKAPGLALAGSWYTDNLTHQEPVVVNGVTAAKGDTLFVAFIASDSGQGPETGGPPLDGSILSVAGGGLTWTRQATAHLAVTGEPGIAEIWTAFSREPVAPFSVTVTRDNSTGANTYCDNWSGGTGPDICNAMVYIEAITGADPADPIGATGVAGAGPRSGKPGAVSVPLTTTRPGSWVEGVGTDWSESAPRVLAAGQTMLHEDVSSPNVDNYWAQRIAGAIAVPGPVSLATTAPVDHDCNLVAIEILPAL
ncbi:MAG: hypothetical protein HZB44_10960 [Actinobacteria bacterium]|nr:hypothetical protein [Actinomycetota bacterium]